MIAYATPPRCLRGDDPALLRRSGRSRSPAARAATACRKAIDAYDREVRAQDPRRLCRAGERYGRRRIAAMLAGDTSDLPAALRDLPSAAALTGDSAQTIGLWLDGAVTAGLITVIERPVPDLASDRERARGDARRRRPGQLPATGAHAAPRGVAANAGAAYLWSPPPLLATRTSGEL